MFQLTLIASVSCIIDGAHTSKGGLRPYTRSSILASVRTALILFARRGHIHSAECTAEILHLAIDDEFSDAEVETVKECCFIVIVQRIVQVTDNEWTSNIEGSAIIKKAHMCW